MAGDELSNGDEGIGAHQHHVHDDVGALPLSLRLILSKSTHAVKDDK
jgi:hypothetical protein